MNKEQIDKLLALFRIAIQKPLDSIEQKEMWRDVRHTLTDIHHDLEAYRMSGDVFVPVDTGYIMNSQLESAQ